MKVNFDNMVAICKNFHHVKEIKITKLEKIGFNSMEGNQLQINLKFISEEGYKNRLFQIFTNSSYFEWYELETKEDLKEFFENCLGE